MNRVWIFASERKFSAKEEVTITSIISKFLNEWKAHGKDLAASVEILEQRFIKISVDESVEAASGCSIDSLTAIIKQIETDFDLNLMNRMNVFYKINGSIQRSSLSEFKQLIKDGHLDDNVQLYHTGVSNETEFQESWLLPISKTWAKSLIP